MKRLNHDKEHKIRKFTEKKHQPPTTCYTSIHTLCFCRIILPIQSKFKSIFFRSFYSKKKIDKKYSNVNKEVKTKKVTADVSVE